MRNMRWAVGIDEMDNGYLVSVGCKKLVFTSKLELLRELEAYMEGKPTQLSEQLKKEMAGMDGMEMQPTIAPPPPSVNCPTTHP